jgi:sulfatase modifying factor 1
MRRLIWIAFVSVCAACSSPPDDGTNESADASPNGTSQDSTVAVVEVDEATETTEPADTSEVAEAADTTDEVEIADTPDKPDMPDAVAAVDPTDSPDSGADAPDVIGLVAEKPAEGRFVETDRGFMVPYKMTIPGTDVEFEMVPIPGGKFTMGSPDSEEDRGDDEGPQIEVEMAPFWMSKYELTWSEYKLYMDLVDTFIGFIGYRLRPVTDDNKFDAVSAPSNLYDPSMTFDKGEDPRQPAVTMTAYAAKQYTKWLSKLTGVIHRLPSEAEWEYACRAGTSTAYHFGDDPADLGDHAWYADNSDETTHPVGEKNPNAWDLYDMYGNVAELVLDEYREDAYGELEGKTVAAADAIAWPADYDFRVYRGGSFDEFEDGCRSAVRKATEGDEWKTEDPNEP